MRSISRLINFKGELFSSTFTYGVAAVIKLGSSLILTRLLNPEAYGIFAILFSILYMVELLSDVGSSGLLIRHARGDEPKFIHTVWTVRLARSCINFCIMYSFAPLISGLYGMPVLTDVLRTFSFWFLLQGMESMAFVVAQRNQRSRIGNYADFACNFVMTMVVIAFASVLKNHYALVYGMLIQRALMTIVSHFYYRSIGVAFAFDREAMADQFRFARFVLPSSILTIVLSQYDKVVLLKLFDLSLLGVYGIAGNMIGPVAGLVMRNCQSVLYARCADYFRTNAATAAARYHSENTRLLAIGTLLPAMVAGFSQTLVATLYDSRYAGAGTMLMVLSLGTMMAAFQLPAENVLLASGRTHVVLVANIVRLLTLVPFTLVGNHLFGFHGFLWFALAATIPVLGYYYREQRNGGMFDARAELRRFSWGLATFALCFAASRTFLLILPGGSLHAGLR